MAQYSHSYSTYAYIVTTLKENTVALALYMADNKIRSTTSGAMTYSHDYVYVDMDEETATHMKLTLKIESIQRNPLCYHNLYKPPKVD